VNQEDVFFFSGSPSDLTAFLQHYSKIQGIESHCLILHDGVGEAKGFWDKTGRACDWKLYGCPKAWLKVGEMIREGTHSTEELREAGTDTNYVLEVHFWTGGHIPLEEVTVPQNVEIKKEK
jgi:hypothetical protein